MSGFLYTLVIIFGAFLISFLLMNVRYMLTGNEFRGTCASNNPLLKTDLGECTMCGKKSDEACKMPDSE